MDKVLIVDDIDINRMILSEILSADYDVVEAENGMDAINYLFSEAQVPDAVLLDIMMPGIDGFEVLQMMKANPKTENIPVLFITAADANINETKGLQEGAVDYISKPFNPDVVKARLYNHIQLQRYRLELEAMVERKTSELMQTHERILETLATIIEYRSLESGTHVRRSSELTKILVMSMLDKPRFKGRLVDLNYSSIIKAVALHDIGKVGIPDNILLKPGKLTPEEFEEIKKHSVIGSNIIDSITFESGDNMYLQHCHDICRHHHERWDGKGYPDGLKGSDIPLSARILTIVDVYDALVNRRCYKPPLGHEDAMNILREGSGTQFDPEIIDCLDDVALEFRELEAGLGEVL
jgi:putative two-component system response regulator